MMAVTRTWIWLEFASSFLVLAFGVVILALQTYALNKASGSHRHFYEYIKWQTTPSYSIPHDSTYQIATVADGTSFGSAIGLQAAGAIGLSMGVFGLFGCLYASTEDRSRLRTHLPGAMAFLALSAFLANLVVFAYATAKRYQSDPLPIPPGVYVPVPDRSYNISVTTTYQYISYFGLGAIGTKQRFATSWSKQNPFYSFEGWTCEARKLAYDTTQLDLGCTFSMAARWLTIPAFLAALFMLVVSYLGYPARGEAQSKQAEKLEK